ncbi:hypothetical protein VSR82_20915 [Burkholderia sp. JPY481]|uniref:hypothetical protein n=1 Tax=Paraburkholderia sp. JPY465 TaxID=3042285 RepID=UPI0031812A9E
MAFIVAPYRFFDEFKQAAHRYTRAARNPTFDRVPAIRTNSLKNQFMRAAHSFGSGFGGQTALSWSFFNKRASIGIGFDLP